MLILTKILFFDRDLLQAPRYTHVDFGKGYATRHRAECSIFCTCSISLPTDRRKPYGETLEPSLFPVMRLTKFCYGKFNTHDRVPDMSPQIKMTGTEEP